MLPQILFSYFVNAILKTGLPDKLCREGIGMVNLSKSKYCALWQCPKMLWLRKYKPELAEVDSHTLSIMETGNAAASQGY